MLHLPLSRTLRVCMLVLVAWSITPPVAAQPPEPTPLPLVPPTEPVPHGQIGPPPAEQGLPPPTNNEEATTVRDLSPTQDAGAHAQGTAPPFFGMNLYLTGLERNDRDDREALAALAAAGGARWTREEIVWAEIGRYRGRYLSFYDRHIRTLARNGFGITGMLVTTPEWARLERCRRATYYCPPADLNEWSRFVHWVVERYDGDGLLDARDGPRVAAWEIWNEPNFGETWPGTPAEYANLLVAAYGAIKAADPTAIVLVGGVYVFDGGQDGLTFLDQVFAANPAAYHAFDVLSIHPYLPTVAPDDAGTLRLVTLEGRIRTSQSRAARWATRWGGAPKPLWVTEVGWCTASVYCTGSEALSPDKQADYLVRSIAIMRSLGVAHLDWFQFEDKFDGGSRAKWGDMALVNNRAQGYAPKVAYAAYRTAAQQLEGATFVGTGPLHTHRYDAARPLARDGGGRYHLVFTAANGARVDLLWQTSGNSVVQLPVTVPAPRVALIDRDGGATLPALRNGVATLSVGERPLYLRQETAPLLQVPSELLVLVQQGQPPTTVALPIRNNGGASFAWNITGLPAWLNAEPANAATPGVATLRVDTAQLGLGESTATLTVSATPEGGTSSVRVRVVVAPNVRGARLPLVVLP